MPRPRPIIALLTDFGLRDWYVAAMKAVIARLAPEARTIDISHDIDPGSIESASFFLSQCYDDFPKGAIFLCVVDPGVGTDRHPIIVDTSRYRFVGPDNGLFGPVLTDASEIFAIEPSKLPPLKKSSNTFHGRDLFAPAAALLATGAPPRSIGRPIARPATTKASNLFRKAHRLPASGQIIDFDRFGNAITDLALDPGTPASSVRLPNGELIPFGSTFADCPVGSAIAYRGSGGLLEIAINQKSARVTLRLQEGDSIDLV